MGLAGGRPGSVLWDEGSSNVEFPGHSRLAAVRLERAVAEQHQDLLSVPARVDAHLLRKPR